MSETIGQRLKRLRSGLKMTQEQMADALSIAHNTYVRYENDLRKPNAENANRLANYFGISVDELLNGIEGTKKARRKSDELREETATLLQGLSPDEIQRVRDFVSGIKSTHAK